MEETKRLFLNQNTDGFSVSIWLPPKVLRALAKIPLKQQTLLTLVSHNSLEIDEYYINDKKV